jgi:type IV pilus assembly protein PilC
MQGDSFSAAIKKTGVFPSFMYGYISIGEQTARLPTVCGHLADYYEGQAQTSDELKAAMMYPAAVTIMMLGVIILAVVMVLPGYTRVFAASGVALPGLTRALLSVSDFVALHGLLMAALFLFAVIAIVIFLQGDRGKQFIALLSLKIPLVRQSISYRLAQAMDLLLSAGLSVSSAIPLCMEVMPNQKVKTDLSRLLMELKSGLAFWEALSGIKYIDPLFAGMARIGEETGQLTQTMEKCHIYFEQNFRHTIRRLNKLIEPIITIFLGILLAFIMLAVVLPTFELATSI